MIRDAGDTIASAHLDVAIGIGARVGGTVLGEGRLEGRVNVAVTCGEQQRAKACCGGQFNALATRHAYIGEIARISGARAAADELDVVLESGAVDRRAPVRRAPLAACTDLNGLRHYFLERWIGKEIVGQLAWRAGVRAGQLDRGRRAHAFGVGPIGGELRTRIEVHADCRIEAAEGVVTVEQRCLASQVFDYYFSAVVAPGQREGPPFAQIERVAYIHPIVTVPGASVRLQCKVIDTDGIPAGREFGVL